jgi:hypothetical protein
MGGKAETRTKWTLRQLGDVWYVRARVKHPRLGKRRFEYSTGHTDRALAEDAAAIIYAGLLTGEFPLPPKEPDVPPAVAPSSGPTFADVADAWTSGQLAEDHPDHVGTKKTADLDASRLAHLCKTIADVPIATFAIEDAERAMRALPESVKTSATRRQYAQLIHRVLGLAVWPMKLLKNNPLPRGPSPRPSLRAWPSPLPRLSPSDRQRAPPPQDRPR